MKKLFLGIACLLSLVFVTSCVNQRQAYTVSFDTNGGSTVASQEVYHDQKVTRPEVNPTKEGHTFVDWFGDESLTTVYDFNSRVRKEFTIYAKWSVNSYDLSYVTNVDGYTLKSKEVNYGTEIDVPKIDEEKFVVTGSTFKGWYLDSEYTTAFSKMKMPAKDTTLYAKWERNDHKISIFVDDIEKDPVMVKYGDKFGDIKSQITTPTKNGFVFDNWYLNKADANPIADDYTIIKDIELHAKWIAKSFTLSFDSKGGSAVASQTYDFNSTITAPATPTKTGYTFAGWYVGEERFDFTSQKMPANDLTLVAKWSANSYTVSYYANTGSGVMEDSKINIEGELTIPANVFTKVGYRFLGWNTKADGTGTNYSDQGKIQLDQTNPENIKLYAQWSANAFVVNFDGNGVNAPAGISTSYDENMTLPAALERIGYRFLGWNTKADGTGTNYAAGQVVKNLSDKDNITLYAKWEQVEYTLTINIQNKLTEIKLHYGDAIPAQADPVVEGYEFDGWFAFINEKWTAFSFENAKMPNSDLLVAAKFLGEVTITFISNGSVYTTLKGFEGEAVTGTVANPTEEGYTFAGWYTDQTFENAYTLPTVYPNESYSIYAKWNINKYTITYNTNGGNTIEAEELDYNSTISAAPTKEGYTFAGWFVDEELSEQITKVPASSTTIYAKWNINTYSVSYNANGGTGETVKQDVDYDDIFKLQNNNFTKEGYNFDSWNTKADGNGNKYLALAEVSKLTKDNNGEIILYAIWTPISYTVIFNNNGGTGEMADLELTYTQNVKLTKNIFTKEGHTFKGWSTKSAANTPDFVDEDYVMNLTNVDNSEITFYAIWEINEYSVKFISEEKTISTLTVEYGTTFGELDEPTVTKVGHSYTWKINDAAVSNDYQIKSDVEIIAAFVKNTYTVSFVVDNKPVYTVTREYGAELDFSEYTDELKDKAEFLYQIDFRLQNQDYSIFTEFFDSSQNPTEKYLKLQKYSPDSIAPLMSILTGTPNQDTISAFYTVINSDSSSANRLYNSYKNSNGQPSKDGYVFKGWVLGENTKYETAKTGDAFEGYVPASDVLSETAYIIASFAGIDPIIISKDVADDTKIIWDQVDINKLGYNTELFTIDVKYEILNKINANEYSRVDVVNNQGFYQFLTKDTYSIPGELNLFIIATVTITEKATNQIKVILSSNYADKAFYYLLSMKENNLNVDQSGDFYYRGTDPDSDLTTFYFFTNMTYDFNTTNFVLTDKDGNPATYADIEIQKGAQGNNSVIKTNDRTTAFYFKTSAESTKIFYAKVHELITSFSLGKELTQFNSIKAGNSLFKNAQNAVYQIGAKNVKFSKDNGTADYDNNGFEFKLTVKTSGGKTVDFKNQPDFLVYEFYQYNETTGKYDIKVENANMGSYVAATNAWEFIPTSGKYQVKISIKETYVAQKYLTDNVITPLTFEFELNDRINIFSHETLKAAYGTVSTEGNDFNKGLNIHANITPIISEIQKHTTEAANAGNPFVGALRDGSIVNKTPEDLMQSGATLAQINKYSGNVYARLHRNDLNENYVISGNLFSINGEKLPYASVESSGNLALVPNIYKIVDQHCAIFLYSVTNFVSQDNCASVSKLTLNDVNITGNTTVPSLNSSSDAELESSIDIMNRNSGGYLGVNLYGGSDMSSNNAIINNTVIGIKTAFGDNDIELDYFYSQANWQSAIFAQAIGDIHISNSHIKDCGGAAIHYEDRFSTRDNVIDTTVYIDQNTIFDNYVSGEEGYFKAYSLEFSVMVMKAQMSEGVTQFSQAMGTEHTMLKDFIDEATGLKSVKVNFIFLSIPTKNSTNSNENGTQTGNVKVNLWGLTQSGTFASNTYGYSSTLNQATNNSNMIYTKLNGSTPVEGKFMSCQAIGAMGNAFMLVGTYKA